MSTLCLFLSKVNVNNFEFTAFGRIFEMSTVQGERIWLNQDTFNPIKILTLHDILIQNLKNMR